MQRATMVRHGRWRPGSRSCSIRWCRGSDCRLAAVMVVVAAFFFCGADAGWGQWISSSTSSDTYGSTSITIRGQSLSWRYNNDFTVTIGGKTCSNQYGSDYNSWGMSNTVTCTAPAGAGVDLPISISTCGCSANIFDYNAPACYGVTGGSTDGITKVTITGNNFGPTGTYVAVWIGGVSCTGASVTVAHTQIQCNPPVGVGTKTVSIQVTSGDSRRGTGSYTYPAPIVSLATPANTDSSTLTTITGTNFGPAGTTATVTIGTGTCSNPTVLSHTQITCYPPPGAGVKRTISVTISGLTGYASVFSYNAPSVSSATSTVTTGAITYITGTNFGPTGTTPVSALIDSTACSNAQVLSQSSISCTTPPGIGGGHNVQVNVSSQTSIAQRVFSYSVPTISSISSPPTDGGRITLVGLNYGPVGTKVAVQVDGKDCNFSIVEVDNTRMSCVIGPGSGQSHDVWLSSSIDSYPLSNTYYALLSYQAPTVITATAVSTDGKNPTVIVGSNFGASASLVSVTVGGDYCSPVSLFSHSALSCFPVPGVGENKAVAVTVSGQTGSNTVFHYSPPVILSAGVYNGSVLINGGNFGPLGTRVKVVIAPDKECSDSIIYVAHTVIKCTPAPGTMGPLVTVWLSNVGDTAWVQTSASVFVPDSPVISSISEPLSTFGNSTVSIHGDHLGVSGSQINITISGTPCRDIVVITNNTELQCTPPPGCGKSLEVVITVLLPGGLNSSTSTSNSFNYPKPIVYSCDNSVTQGELINIYGVNFGPVDSIDVQINSQPCTNVSLLEPHVHLSCIAPPGAGAFKPLSVSVPSSGSSAQTFSSITLFNYSKPSIINATPVNTNGLVQTTITGQNFGPLGTQVFVQIGLHNCSSATITVAHTEIKCYPPPGVGTKALSVGTPLDDPQFGYATFRYADPIITGGSSFPTQNGFMAYIYGENFGEPNETSVWVTIRGVSCKNASVVSHTKILCSPPPGEGTAALVTVGIAPKGSSDFVVVNATLFSYTYPEISNATQVPTTGTTQTTILGQHFGPVGGTGVHVKINGLSCEDPQVVKDDTEITCLPPPGAGANLPVVVYFIYKDLNASSPSTPVFSYEAPIPSYSSSTPTAGNGTTVIVGKNFGPAGTLSEVEIGGQKCNNSTVLNHTHITCVPQAGAGADLIVLVRVASPGADFTVGKAYIFSYDNPIPFSSTSVDTLNYPPMKTLITGTNFGPVGTPVNVTIDGQWCTNATVTIAHTEIQCYPPNGIGVNVTTTIFVLPKTGNQTEGYADIFSYNGPIVYSATGINTYERVQTRISGKNFGPLDTVVRVTINGSECTEAAVSVPHHEIQCYPPANVTGAGLTVTVFVARFGRPSLQYSASAFSYNFPTVSFASSADTAGSTSVMIYGTNFGTLDAAGGVSVRIGGKPCLNATIWVDHFQIKCIAPPGVGADVDVGVWVPAEGKFGSQRCNSSVFDYTAPSISSVSRANTDGNESLTIEGFNLGSSLDATFNITIGGQPCRKPWVSKNHTKVSCYPPPGYGVLPLRLWIPSDPNHAQHTDSVFSYKAPEITSASPIDTDAPSKTVISGANFGPIGANVTVRINSVNCPNAFVQVAHKQIACSPPPGCGSSMKVEVLVPGLDHYASSNVFSYNAPKLDSTTSCDTKGGIPVILTGSNFGPLNSSVAVTIDGKICANASVSRAHVEITCIPPPGAGGLLPVQVSIPATSTGYSFPLSSTKSIFSYNVPTLSSAGGSGTDGRQEAIIYGSNFGPLGTNVGVKINGDVCSSARVKVAHTQIGCSPPVGAGAGLNVTVYIPDSDTAQTATAAIFSYDPPTISYTTKAPTNGQNRTKIYGTGFGPLNSSIGVFVGEAICKDARVETAHTMVSCFPPEGTGTDHTVIITVPNVGSGQQSAPGTFSYDSPVVLQATPANTTGDSKTIITGMNFGPLETVVSATIWGVECIHASVVFPHTEIECYPPPGVGCGNALQVYVPKGSAQSAYMTDYCYEKPVIETFPATQTLGEHIILKGINFGPGGVIYSIYVFIDSDDIFFSGTLINQTAILVHIPAGTGIHHTLAITVKGQKSNSILFDYQGPSIFSATATGTAGDEYTKITGLNFGPLSTQVHVTIGGEKCEDAQVTTPGSEISCLPPAGVGTNKTVRVTVPYDSPVSQTASAIVFSYQAPIIDFANAGSCSGELNISGANFGSVINKISVSVGHRTCTDLKFVLPNSGLKCQLPSNSQPWDEVIVTVASQHSSAYGLRCVKQKGKGLAIGLGVAGAFVFTAGLACIVVFAVLRRKKMNPEKEVAMSSLWTTMQEDDPSKEVFDESHSTAVSVTDFLLQVSVTSISLGLNGHRASVDQHLEETVILTNTSKKYISFKWFPPATYKINTLFEPAAGIIPPSGETRVKIGASILCTTALDSSLILAASVGHVYAERPLQHISLPIKIESKLSTKLDPDEIVLHPPPIGEGSFGFVYRGEWRGQQVAVKILKNQELGSAQIYKDFLNEIKTMESFRCPQIVGFVGAVHIKRRLAILTEFMELGSLTTTIANTKLSIKQKYKIALDTARGMNYLHQSGVIHRDLKTDNVLLCSLDPASAVCAKITDFGTTRDVQTSKEALQMTKAIGTPSYMSPEILQNANYDASTDTYSFAVLCYSLFVEKVPFGEDEFPSAWKIAEFVINGNRLPLPENKVPAECKTLITECWATAPTDRPPFSTVVTTLESLFASC